jgi:hypothetical protein
MSRRKLLNGLSLICLGLFCLLATGSMDSNSSPSSTSTSVSSPSSSIEAQKQSVMNAVKLRYTWSTDGMIMTINFKIDNVTDHDFKDFEITCNHFAPSGTKIDSNTRTIYEVVKAHGKKSMNHFNMGFIHSQAASSDCRMSNLTLVD